MLVEPKTLRTLYAPRHYPLVHDPTNRFIPVSDAVSPGV